MLFCSTLDSNSQNTKHPLPCRVSPFTYIIEVVVVGGVSYGFFFIFIHFLLCGVFHSSFSLIINFHIIKSCLANAIFYIEHYSNGFLFSSVYRKYTHSIWNQIFCKGSKFYSRSFPSRIVKLCKKRGVIIVYRKHNGVAWVQVRVLVNYGKLNGK